MFSIVTLNLNLNSFIQKKIIFPITHFIKFKFIPTFIVEFNFLNLNSFVFIKEISYHDNLLLFIKI